MVLFRGSDWAGMVGDQSKKPKVTECILAAAWVEKHIIFQISRQDSRASLVVQWLRIHLPMQGTRVRALVRVDPTCRGATKPVSHSY
ncbi:hypothetical protein J1605_009721 [Eschrichtius robustus]|uniref:Uncharacterized protein n=1 Tax=Eschrichtius robustus TaxID=9764 RepID=A0AB34GUW1_ESCRO|nr:hypothetical protein J1605_009721 [Eschrichtius robustus]